MLFVQTSAPTGWTKDTDQNDKALRIVSGTPSTGGTSSFSTVFGKTATDAHTLTTTEIPAHTHPLGDANGELDVYVNDSGSGQGSDGSFAAGSAITANDVMFARSAGGGGSHTHGMDIRVQYVDVIKATKD